MRLPSFSAIERFVIKAVGLILLILTAIKLVAHEIIAFFQ